MTLAGRLAALFPMLLMVGVAWAFFHFVCAPSLATAGLVLAIVYLLPLALFRLHNLFFPLVDVIMDIAQPTYSPWWTTHQLQWIYIAAPILELPLHAVPGLFSLWLRLWGSKIGRGVYWTPRTEVIDRGLLVVGDRVIVGHMAIFCSHAISPVKGKLSLIVQHIEIGSGAFVGAEARFGPGAKIEAGQTVKVRSAHYWKGVFN